MQGTDHNKIIGIIHIAYGAFSLVVMIIMVIFMVGVFGVLAADQDDARPLGFIGVVMVVALLINVVFTAPSSSLDMRCSSGDLGEGPSIGRRDIGRAERSIWYGALRLYRVVHVK